MKIERVNDRQIRCTLTGADLAVRQLKISELAYGSEKAKSLFRDMMRQAEYECGFEVEDIPLVIEAIPVNSDCIILIITKVEDPEELDTRFSKFAPSVSESSGRESSEPTFSASDFAEEMINMLREVKGSLARRQSGQEDADDQEDNSKKLQPCLLECKNLGFFTSFAKAVLPYCNEDATLYRDENGSYALLLRPGQMNDKDFARVCNSASEFGNIESVSDSRQAFIEEHYDSIIPHHALEALTRI